MQFVARFIVILNGIAAAVAAPRPIALPSRACPVVVVRSPALGFTPEIR